MCALQIQFDKNAGKCIALAKAVARGRQERFLDAVHIVEAALLAFPEEASVFFGRTSGGWPNSMWSFVDPLEDGASKDSQMALSRELLKILRGLTSGNRCIDLITLLKAILRHSPVRVKALVGRTQRNLHPDLGAKLSLACIRPYASRRDWLADLHTEWRVRKAAATACGLLTRFSYEDDGPRRYRTTSLDAVTGLSATRRTKAEASRPDRDPLADLSQDLGPCERDLCEGVLVEQLYGLDVHPAGGLSIRYLAQLISPEVYPGNCREVCQAAQNLIERGILTGDDPANDPDILGRRIYLARSVFEQILVGLQKDGISAGEMEAIKRALRQDRDWGGEQVTKSA